MSFETRELIGMIFTGIFVTFYQTSIKIINTIKSTYNDLDIAYKVAKQCFKDMVL